MQAKIMAYLTDGIDMQSCQSMLELRSPEQWLSTVPSSAIHCRVVRQSNDASVDFHLQDQGIDQAGSQHEVGIKQS